MNRRSIPARLNALEEAKPEPTHAWARVIVPEGLTPEEGEALVAAEREKLPPGTGVIVRRIV